MQGAYDEIGFRFINEPETLKMFDELTGIVQSKIIQAALKKAVVPIMQQAKSNFEQGKKNKSETSYSYIRKAFKIEATRRQKDELGIKFGITKEGYKIRWIEWGTSERYTERSKKRAKKYTGALSATNFFFKAVESKMEEAKSMISDEIKLSLERTVAKYNAKDTASN